jgi:precorrin-6A/cobalt-precorrin-6A reductase
VAGHGEAASTAAELGEHPFLTVGRQALGQFIGPLERHRAVARVVDAPTVVLPASWMLILSRGPYTVESERAVFDEHDVDVLVTKDSGGTYTWAKMQVAAERGTPVVIVRRGNPADHVPTVTDPAAAAVWVRDVVGG